MKKVLGILLVGFLVLSLTGCTIKYPELEKDAIGFKTNNYIDENDGTEYLTFEYNGRTYIPYGTLKGKLKEKDINKCVGYIIQDENSSSVINENDKDTRVYTLMGDSNNNYIMVYYIKTTLMNQPDFYRATDTKNKKIDPPNYINSLDYNYWK